LTTFSVRIFCEVRGWANKFASEFALQTPQIFSRSVCMKNISFLVFFCLCIANCNRFNVDQNKSNTSQAEIIDSQLIEEGPNIAVEKQPEENDSNRLKLDNNFITPAYYEKDNENIKLFFHIYKETYRFILETEDWPPAWITIAAGVFEIENGKLYLTPTHITKYNFSDDVEIFKRVWKLELITTENNFGFTGNGKVFISDSTYNEDFLYDEYSFWNARSIFDDDMIEF
jgi:hypothetical protein